MKAKSTTYLMLLILMILGITCQDDDPIQYSLDVNVSPSEGGNVSPTSGVFEDGEIISLNATPSSEYIFKNWSGAITGTNNPITVVMTSDKSVTAVFEKKQYDLTIEIDGDGDVSEKLLASKPNEKYPSGSLVELTATPEDGWEFVQWSGDIEGSENPVTLTVDEPKNVKAMFQPILLKKIIGKWDIDNSSLLSSKNTNRSEKTNEQECIVYSIVFNEDGSFILSLDSEEIRGTFYFDSSNSIILNDRGRFDNIHIHNNKLNFHLNLNNLCSIDGEADEDDDYVEGECVSFLNCNDGNVWVKQTDTGFKYVRVLNDLENIWIEHYSFNTNWECTSDSMTNLTSEYTVILLENDIEQMTYVLDDTPDGDIEIKLIITADDHLSVNYDYSDNNLDETDYYDLSTEESLNQYLNTYENCPERTYIPDDNFEQELIDLGYDDVMDDYVLTSNINTIEYINLDNKEIADATGIEDFTSLLILIISQNNLSSIDLSKNLNLEELQISVNELTELDVSNNLNLGKLYVEGNDIAQIDISKNLELFHLAISGSPITSLDVTIHNKLERLEVNNTLLESLDVTQNPLLWYLDMNNFDSTNYQHTISSIDLTNNPQLKVLIANHTTLSEIDLSNNSLMEHLEIYDNNLSEIDVSNMNNLVRFETFLNNLTCIKVSESQLSNIPSGWIKEDTVIYSTNCNMTYVPDDNFEQALIEYGFDDVLDDYVITNNIRYVDNIDLSNRQISDATGIEDFDGLTGLHIQQNNLSSIDISFNSNLTNLWIYDNNLTSLDISNNNNLRFLFAELNNISELDVSTNPLIEHLALSANPLISLDVSSNELLIRLEVNNTLLSSLDVANNQSLVYLDMGNDSQLYSQHSISSVDLTKNTELITLRINNVNLEALDLSYNSKLEQLEVKNTNILSLDVSHMNNLNILYAELNQLSCIKVNETQIQNIPSEWYKDEETVYSLDCGNSVGTNFFDDFNDCMLGGYFSSGGTVDITSQGKEGCGVGMTHYAGQETINFYHNDYQFQYGIYEVDAIATSSISDNMIYLFQQDAMVGGLRFQFRPNNTDNPGFSLYSFDVEEDIYTNSNINVSRGEWYNIQIQVEIEKISVYLNDELMYEIFDYGNYQNQFGYFKIGVVYSGKFDNLKFTSI